jgi:hypothetical protein
MYPLTSGRGADRDTRRWQEIVKGAKANLAHRIALTDTGSETSRDGGDRIAKLTRLRQRLGRIIDRYGTTLD